LHTDQIVTAIPCGPQYQIIVDRPETMDIFTIKAELTEGISGKTDEELDQLRRRIAHKVQNVTGLTPILELVDSGVLPRTEGKAKRVLDLRSGKI